MEHCHEEAYGLTYCSAHEAVHVVKREPVDFDYTALNWDFIKWMAWIPMHATQKYGSWEQYTSARLVGEKSPINHAIEHLRMYMAGEPYDKLDGDLRRHLASAGYNIMMEFWYATRYGLLKHPLVIDRKEKR